MLRPVLQESLDPHSEAGEDGLEPEDLLRVRVVVEVVEGERSEEVVGLVVGPDLGHGEAGSEQDLLLLLLPEENRVLTELPAPDLKPGTRDA